MAGLLTELPHHHELAPDTQRSLVVVAHRGPVCLAPGENGVVVAERNGGGLVSALRDVARRHHRMRWLCATATGEERALAEARGWADATFDENDSCSVQMCHLEPQAHHDFYAVVANPLLWFIQHNMWDHSRAPSIGAREWSAWHNGYVAVNRRFAEMLDDRDAAPVGSIAMIHDYHFYLLPALVRPRRPDLFLQHFTHIPWPQPDAWRVLPPVMRKAIFTGLLGSDIVGFQTQRYVDNFLLGCHDIVGAEVDLRRGMVKVGHREVTVRRYPISVDEACLRAVAASPEARARRTEFDEMRERTRIILRVDRTDPSKNIVRGFEAFARMLERHPEMAGTVTFVALLQPSRQDVPEYATYLASVEEIVNEVNARFGTEDWTPIDLRLGHDMAATVAAYATFDVLFVNPVCDGMNLVAKEGLLLNESDGVLVLSENAGAHDELGEAALTAHPFDLEQQARTLHDALTMPLGVRRSRRLAGVSVIRANNVHTWFRHQIEDITAALGATSPPGVRASVPA